MVQGDVSLMLWTRAQPNHAPRFSGTLPDIELGGLITSIPPPSERVSVAQTGPIVAVYMTMQDGRLRASIRRTSASWSSRA